MVTHTLTHSHAHTNAVTQLDARHSNSAALTVAASLSLRVAFACRCTPTVTKEHRSKSHSLGVILEGDQLSDSGLSVAFKSQSPPHAASDALLLCSWRALALDHCEHADVGARLSQLSR